MSDRAVEFVESWIDQHVTYGEKGGDSTRAATLAEMCRDAATTLGVSIEDIKPEFGTLEASFLKRCIMPSERRTINRSNHN